jgi:hypothetical protein
LSRWSSPCSGWASSLDAAAFPAAVVAATYHERGEVEAALAEVKVHQWARPRPLRSRRPWEVVREASGPPLAHLTIRTLM